MARTMWTKTRRSKKLGNWLLAYTREGVGGVVPNHAPHTRKVMISRNKYGWHLHLTLTTLHTWNGYCNAKFEVALHPSKARTERLQAKYEEERA